MQCHMGLSKLKEYQWHEVHEYFPQPYLLSSAFEWHMPHLTCLVLHAHYAEEHAITLVGGLGNLTGLQALEVSMPSGQVSSISSLTESLSLQAFRAKSASPNETLQFGQDFTSMSMAPPSWDGHGDADYAATCTGQCRCTPCQQANNR